MNFSFKNIVFSEIEWYTFYKVIVINFTKDKCSKRLRGVIKIIMEELTKKAFSEVNEIINHLDKKNQNKIPQSVRDFIKNNKDETYIMNINFEKSLVSQNLLDQTNIILSILYREYIRDKDKKVELKQQGEKNLANYKFLWSKNNENKQTMESTGVNNESNLPIKADNNPWYKRLYNLIKSLFKKKK